MIKYKIYLIIAAAMFFISLFRLDFENLSWIHNKDHYIGMLFSLLAFVLIYITAKGKLNK